MNITVTITVPDDLARREKIEWSTLPDYIRSAVQSNMIIGAIDASRVNVRYRGVVSDEELSLMNSSQSMAKIMAIVPFIAKGE